MLGALAINPIQEFKSEDIRKIDVIDGWITLFLRDGDSIGFLDTMWRLDEVSRENVVLLIRIEGT